MKVDDRSEIPESIIQQLWQQDFFSTIDLTTVDGHAVKIISKGVFNEDGGPDFKGISIKFGEKIHHGDLEIHRAPEDWYQHAHHADPAYNNVIMHLVIGRPERKESAIRLNRHPVLAQVFVEIQPDQISYLLKKYPKNVIERDVKSFCGLNKNEKHFIVSVIDYFGRQRLQDKADRFAEQRETSSWNQILYVGIMEALGYSKNQIPFRKLAYLIPFEAIKNEFDIDDNSQSLGVLLGAAGLLPSQDTSFDWKKVKDQETQEYIPKLENIWKNFIERVGLEPMQKEEWQFFRMRPSNFPTRRLAGASLILQRFSTKGILETILHVIAGANERFETLVRELENYFICETTGYWASHFTLDEETIYHSDDHSATLIGKQRARDIVINIVLPVILAYSEEISDSRLKNKISQFYQTYPKIASNSITKKMSNILFEYSSDTNNLISTAMKQQGLIHLYKLYCHRLECDRCKDDWGRLIRE